MMLYYHFISDNAILLSILACLSLCVVLAYLRIKHLYGVYDNNKTLEEEIDLLKLKIKGADDYFYKNYNTDFNSSVYNNIKTKLDFCTKLIEKEENKDKLLHYNQLFNNLYETGYRLKTNFDNVHYVIAPLTEFYKNLVKEHIEFIKNNMEENEKF